MATRTKPLISAAALASAAAIAVVSPGVSPNLGVPTPAALSRAAYQLTTITDVLDIPAQEWTNILFGTTSWGNVLGPENYGPDWAAPADAFGWYGYVNPWAAYCANTCNQTNITGAAYLFFDALINGEGKGYANADEWKIGLVNYFFEPNSVFQLGGGSSPSLQYVSQGLSAAAWYILQGTVGRLVPGTSVPLASAFWGPTNVSVFYNFSLSIVAQVFGAVPLVGPLIGNSILAYLGDLSLEQGTQDTYQYGLSGLLNYWIDVADGSVPYPTQVPWYEIPAAAATVRAASAVETEAAEGSETEGTEAHGTEAEGSEAEGTETHGTETEGAETEGTETEGAETHGSEAEGTETHGTEAEGAETEGTETEGTEVEVADGTEVEATKVETEPVETAPVETPVAPVVAVPVAEAVVDAPVEAPVAPKRQRPIRDAVEKAGKKFGEAVANAKAAKAERVAARKAKVKAGSASAE